MKKRIFAALSAAVVSAFLLSGCATTISTPSAAGPEPVNLNDSAEMSALCDASAKEALDAVKTAAKADEDSGRRNTLTKWGLTSAEVKDEKKLEEIQAMLQTRVETPCKEIPSDGTSVGVEDNSGAVANLPLVAGTGDTLVIDTTTQAATPPVVPGLLKGKRFTVQTLTWEGVAELLKDQPQLIEDTDARASETNINWDNIQKFASVNKVVNDRVQGVNALAIQVFNGSNITDEQARDMVREYITPKEEEVIGLTVDELPLQRINNGFINTRNIGSTTVPRMGNYFDTQTMVRVSLMPITFDANGNATGLDGSRGAGFFIDCGNLHWVPKAMWYCKTDSCEKPPPPPYVPPYIPPVQPECPDCLQPKGNRTPNNGWTPLGPGKLTDGRESQRQQQSGETRGNAVNDQVPSNTTNGSTTPDTRPSDQGGPVAPGAQPGGDDQSQGVVDQENTNQDPGGTSGDTCVPDPIAGITC